MKLLRIEVEECSSELNEQFSVTLNLSKLPADLSSARSARANSARERIQGHMDVSNA
jgi:hypothetical protein